MRSLAPRGGGFPKGVSGNPGGRPAGVGAVRTLARRYTAEAVAKLVEKMRSGRTDTIQVNAAVELLVWGYGRPAPLVPDAAETGRILVQFVEDWRDPDGLRRRQIPDVKDVAQRIVPHAEAPAEGQRRLPAPREEPPSRQSPSSGFVVR
jgi:hypothetical protein